ncbi:MAG: ABC transporter ATP-binding protein [Candidatus Hydrogenedentota bacterium]
MTATPESSDSGAVLALRGVGVRKEGRWLLRDITWTVRRGEHWALLGANGSGKTTLLKIVTGYEWPTEGTVSVRGRRLGECHVPELRKTIGWVSSALERRIPPRDCAMTVALSGLDASFGVYRNFGAAEQDRARQSLDQLGLTPQANQPFETLSQGERQRVLIARALTPGPALLVLDEPCAGLDPAAREGFLARLSALRTARPDLTLVLVTHHIEEIHASVDNVLVLKQGEILACGAPPDMLQDHVLTEAFDHPCSVARHNGRYTLTTFLSHGDAEKNQ